MPDKYKTFVEAVLMKTAFLGGLWSYIELNPRKYALLEIVRALQPYLEGPMLPDADFIGIIKLGFMLVFLGGVIRATFFGSPKGVGLLSFGLAYGSGYTVMFNQQLGVILLFISGLIALFLAETSSQQRQTPTRPPL